MLALFRSQGSRHSAVPGKTLLSRLSYIEYTRDMRRYESGDRPLQRPGASSNQPSASSHTTNEKMPHCASNRFHTSQASAGTCTKHHSNHFDTLSTLSRVMARGPGQAVAGPPAQPQAVPAAPPQPQVVIYVQPQQPQYAHNIGTAAQSRGGATALQQQAHARTHLRAARRIVQTQDEASDSDPEESEPDQNDEESESESNAPSQQPSRSTRRPGSTVESWIGHLEQPAPPTPSSVEQPPRASSSAGSWDDHDADDDTLNDRPTPEIEAQPVTFRETFRDPIIYCLAVLGISIVTLFILVLCAWFVWRYHINAVEFEYLEKMRKQKYGV